LINPYLQMRRLLSSVLDRAPYIGNLRQKIRNEGEFPAGHFHSPIPVRDEALAYFRATNGHDAELPEIRLNSERQLDTLREFQAYYAEMPFPEHQNSSCRYYFDQSVFCYADAIFLYSFLRHVAPKRIIEVGSGFSSAVILDTVERFFSFQPAITFIEPYPTTLKRLLRNDDKSRVTVIEKKVQDVPVDTFNTLQAGDLLFIDSSHVLKCGSDLQFLLFRVLPQLPAGVFVHFHDVFRGFEYPEWWLEKGWYWNEDYVLRAFLAYNDSWEIYLFNHYAGEAFKDFIAEGMPLCLKNTGGSLYLRRTGKGT
jgi:hypothetical protein